MSRSEIDTGARCDDHVGEVFPPRCSECEELRSQPREVEIPNWPIVALRDGADD